MQILNTLEAAQVSGGNIVVLSIISGMALGLGILNFIEAQALLTIVENHDLQLQNLPGYESTF